MSASTCAQGPKLHNVVIFCVSDSQRWNRKNWKFEFVATQIHRLQETKPEKREMQALCSVF